ncbi:MAG: SDR family NAD(P)-dependent oxidoreductase [Alphaproteobacteria bacterium]
MNAIVFGANGGIGGALVTALMDQRRFERVFAVARHPLPSDALPQGAHPLLCPAYTDEALAALAEQIAPSGPVTLCISALGLLSDPARGLSPERSVRDLSAASFEAMFAANTIAPALIAKHVFPLMPRKERAVFAALSARVGSIADNRLGGWHAYRASKTALNMLIRNFAIEQARRAPEFIAVGLHPGTVDTRLSEPFQRNVPEGKLFTTARAAGQLLAVLDGLTPAHSGGVYDWQGAEVPA